MAQWRTIRKLRGLCFDIENKPGTYGPGDYTHPKVTAVAWQFLDHKRPRSIVFNRADPDDMRLKAERFRAVWDAADFVMGHNIRRHDTKILNGLYTALNLPILTRKRMVDTYLDQPKMEGLSRSLENLAARWGCPIEKLSMPEHAWDLAYDGVPKYVERMRKRAESDVAINIWLHRELLERGLL